MTLVWEAAFELGYAEMDATHKEFVDLLSREADTSDADFLAYFDHLIDHTKKHFDDELTLMVSGNFLSRREHEDDHNRILAELMQMRRFAARGMTPVARSYITDKLPDWFKTHAATMDTALALHLLSRTTRGDNTDKPSS